MFNLCKADVYRMVHMKSFWVCIVVSVALMVTIAGFMNWISSPEFTAVVNESVTERQMEGMSAEEQAEMQAQASEGLTELEPLNEKVLPSLTDTWLNTFFDGGFLGVIGSIFVVIFLMRDFQGGFIKNYPLDRRGRFAYFGAKLIVVALIEALFLLICAAVTAVAFWAFGFTYESQDSFGGILGWLGLVWLVCTAYGFMMACLTLLVKSEALSAVVAVLVPSSILGSIVVTVLNYFGVSFPILNQVPQWLMVSTYGNLRGGAAGLTNVVGEGVFAALPVWSHVVILAAIYMAVMAVLVLTVCRKQDIR